MDDESDYGKTYLEPHLKSENDISITEAFYENILYHSTHPLVVINPKNLKLLYLNGKAYKIFYDFSLNNKILSMRDIIRNENDLNKVQKLIEEKTDFKNLRIAVKTKNNNQVDAFVTIQNREHESQNFVVLHFFISDDKLANYKSTIEENEFLREIIDKQRILLAKIDAFGNFLFANQYFAELYNLNPSDLIGTSVFNLIIPEARESAKKEFRNVFNNPEQYEFYVDSLTTKGVRKIQCTGKVILKESGEIDYLIGMGQDCTNRVLEKEESEKVKRELEELNHIKDKVIAEISHDLKGPIGSLKVAMELLLNTKKSLSGEDFENFFVAIDKSVSHVHGLLSNLMDWSVMELGKIKPNFERIKTFPLFQQILCELNRSRKGTDVVADIHIPVNSTFKADRYLITMLFKKIIEGIINSFNKENKITIESFSADEDIIFKISYSRGCSKQAKLEQLNKINKTGQINLTNKEKGVDLEIIIIKKIIEIHKGLINFEFANDDQVVITVKLPNNLC